MPNKKKSAKLSNKQAIADVENALKAQKKLELELLKVKKLLMLGPHYGQTPAYSNCPPRK